MQTAPLRSLSASKSTRALPRETSGRETSGRETSGRGTSGRETSPPRAAEVRKRLATTSSSLRARPAALDELDLAAAELGHQLSPLRLALGEALNALDYTNGYRELGFSSVGAYANERVGKPKRWAAESRVLATNLERLTTLRRQLISGRLLWTRAELLAKLVERSLATHDIMNPDAAQALRPALELSWLFRSSGMTCRELNDQLRAIATEGHSVSSGDGFRHLTLTIPAEDIWWFHAAERTFRRLAERVDLDGFLEALLAETQNTLQSCGAVTREDDGFEARDRWRLQLDEWQTHAEHLCEQVRQPLPQPRSPSSRRASWTWPAPRQLRTWSPLDLNRYIISLARQLHLGTTALGRNAEQLHTAQAWRRLGFASAGHYARERLGVSLSSLKQKRALARRLERLPRLAEALETGQLGSVAASLIARVATSKTERRWVERARQRTVKHLREEVAFVERILRSRPGHRGWPPTPEVIRADLAVRGAILSGQLSSELRTDPVVNAASARRSGGLRHSPSEQHAHSEHNLRSEQPPHTGHHHDAASRSHSERQYDSEQQRRHLEQIHDYARGIDAVCSRQHPSAPTASRQPSSPPPVNRVAFNPSCGPSPQDACIRSGPAGRAPNASTTPGQTSVGETPADCSSTCCPRKPRECTAEPLRTVRTARAQVTGDGLALGSVRLRLRLCECTLLLYREVARAFARQHPARRLMRSLCEHFLTIWSPVLARQHKHKYDHIYARDAYTCTSPVCERHDVTPHHLRFRSRGGGDEPENLTSLCVWCHLEGVHGGRMRAEPGPSGIHWTIGRVAPMRVVDRDKAEPTEVPPVCRALA